jgi:hypothetical protein
MRGINSTDSADVRDAKWLCDTAIPRNAVSAESLPLISQIEEQEKQCSPL